MKATRLGYDNLDMEEREGLKSLKERIKAGDIIICATDKSGRFAVLSRKQYIEAGEEHTKNDKEINLEESKAVERELNGHMRWWADMTGLGEHWNQKDRSVRNLLNHGLATCPMTLMVKDHKTWSVESGKPPPTRSIMGGNVGGNKGLSEFMSLVLEPVAKKMDSMETNATNGLLSVIEELNKDLTKRKEKGGNPSSHQEEPSIHQEDSSSHQEESADTCEKKTPPLERSDDCWNHKV